MGSHTLLYVFIKGLLFSGEYKMSPDFQCIIINFAFSVHINGLLYILGQKNPCNFSAHKRSPVFIVKTVSLFCVL